MPTIADGYGLAGNYLSTVVFVEKGKQVSVSSNYNIDSTAHYFVPLVGGYCVTSVFSRLSGILCHCRKAVA